MSNVRFEALERRIAALGGTVGAVVAAEDGTTLFEHDAGGTHPVASVIKLPLAMALYAEAAAGRIDLGERVAVGRVVGGAGVLRHLRDVAEVSLRDHATLALIASDNTATNRLIERVGSAVVNAYLERWGCPGTRLRRGMFDADAERAGLENEMTPRDAARLLGILARGELVDRATSDALLDTLARSLEPVRLGRFLPDGTWIAHKTGTLERVRNDAGVVRMKSRVAVAVFCSGFRDPASADDAIGLAGWLAYRAAGGDGAELPESLGGPVSALDRVV